MSTNESEVAKSKLQQRLSVTKSATKWILLVQFTWRRFFVHIVKRP